MIGDPSFALRVGPRFRLPAFPGEALPPRLATATYYDTADHALALAGVSLARRVERRAAAWRLELPCGAGRVLLEVPGRRGDVPAAVRDLVTAYARGRELGPVATLRSRRAALRVRGLDGPLADVVLETIAVLDARPGSRKVLRRLRRLEVEGVGGDEAALDRIVQGLRAAGAEDGDGRPPVLQALDLPRPAPPAPPDPGAPAAEHLGAMIQAQLAALLAHDPGARVGADPEALHHMRVATRRLRAVLRAARPMLATEWVEPLREELAWLGDLLGSVRDLDVLLARLRDDAAALEPPERRAATRLLRRLAAERAQARAALLDGLRSQRYLDLLGRLEEAGRAPRVVAAVSLNAIAGSEFRKLRRAMRALGEAPTDAELHAVRIRGRRARYATELAEAAVGEAASRFIRRAQVFQDVLGEHQDASVAERRIRQLVASARARWAAFAAGRLVERQRARREAARAALPDTWAKLEKRGRAAWP
ncbi:MAG: CHAD domain-containing protein [Candidatus Rokubacteria bacterium]|nr:CHAD domain-containing protein [Candidatus Rokubacteria bacterium]